MPNASANTGASPPAQLVPWVVWFAFLPGIVMFRFLLVQPVPPGTLPPPDVFPWALSLVPVLLSAGIRWLWLPQAPHAQQALIRMLAGIALAETTTFFAIFLTPSRLDLLVVASFLGVFQFAPIWARRFYDPQPEHPAQNLIPRLPR